MNLVRAVDIVNSIPYILQMTVWKKTRGYVQALPRYPASTQRLKLVEFGVHPDDIYEEGKGAETRQAAIRSLRKGYALAVTRLGVLAKVRKLTTDAPRKDLKAAIQEVEAQGACIVEVDTGLCSANVRERDDMIFAAIDALSTPGRRYVRKTQSKHGSKGGRPKKEFTPEQIEQARAAWLNIKLRTIRDVKAHLPKGFSVSRCYKMFRKRSPD